MFLFLKLLFFTDFFAYAKFGEPITNIDYCNQEYGPAPVNILSILNAMTETGEIEVIPTQVFTQTQMRPVAKRSPDVSVFNSREVALVDNVIDELKHMTAEEVSDYSHHFIGWKITERFEKIPYYTVFYRDTKEEEITEADVEMAAKIEESLTQS